ncbi:MAG: hypothetical protein GWN13_20010, partial [Phycisphaerae bacterium]|nr:hypothetical protein [Phycisphaerae bacterium]
MLVAHLVPGYFITIQSKSRWQPNWTVRQCALLRLAALGSTIAPDLDVVYNVIFHDFFNHSTLWTHSLFPYISILFIWWILRQSRRWPYLQMLAWLIALGGISHLLLDVVAHGTPLLYPLLVTMVGVPPQRVVEGGVWAYLTDPIFLFEPFLLTLAAIHWLLHNAHDQRVRIIGLIILIAGLSIFTTSFLLL